MQGILASFQVQVNGCIETKDTVNQAIEDKIWRGKQVGEIAGSEIRGPNRKS